MKTNEREFVIGDSPNSMKVGILVNGDYFDADMVIALTETNRLLNLECEELKGDVEKLESGLRDCINALIEASQYSCCDYQKVIEKSQEILGD